MEDIIKKREVPPLPQGILIKYGNWEFNTSDKTEIKDLSETGVKNIVEKIRSGLCESLYLTPDENGEIDGGFLQLECGGGELIFLQIVESYEKKTCWACFDPDYLDSDEEAPIEPSDGSSIFPMACTMQDRELAAKCVEWYAHTCEPYPGMDWLKQTNQ